MTITVAGTYTSPDESPLAGWVALSLANPRAVHSTAPEFVASKRVVSELDETGSVSFEVTASDDPGWALPPVLYRIEEHLSQQEHLTWFGYLIEPVEGGGVRLEEVARVADPELGYWPPAYIPVPGPAGPAGPPGSDANATWTGSAFSPPSWATFEFSKTSDILDIPDTWTEVNRLSVDVVASGTYLFAVSLTWLFDVTNRSALFRFSRDGGQSWGAEYSVEPGDNSDVYPFAYGYPVTYEEDESLEVVMQARKESANGTLDVSFCDISFQRVG